MKYTLVLGLAGLAMAIPAPQGWETYAPPSPTPQPVTEGWQPVTTPPVPAPATSTAPAPSPPTPAPPASWGPASNPVPPTPPAPVSTPSCPHEQPPPSWSQWTTPDTPVIVTTTTPQGWNTWGTISTPVVATTTPSPMPPVSTTSPWAVWTSSVPVIQTTSSAWQVWTSAPAPAPVSSTQWQTASVPSVTPTTSKLISSYTGAAVPTALPQAFGAGIALVAAVLVL